MKVILDTHAFIWFVQGDNRLPLGMQELISAPESEIYVSIISFWEMAIKISLNKLDLTQELPKIYENALISDFKILPIHSEAVFQLTTLPMHHRDPFDRLIIATALNQSLPLVTKDQQFQAYQSLNILWS